MRRRLKLRTRKLTRVSPMELFTLAMIIVLIGLKFTVTKDAHTVDAIYQYDFVQPPIYLDKYPILERRSPILK